MSGGVKQRVLLVALSNTSYCQVVQTIRLAYTVVLEGVI
jgi:hypothetical protein